MILADAVQIDGVAYTAGPGLAGALLVGAAFARSLAWAWGAGGGHPSYGGHLLAPMLEAQVPEFCVPLHCWCRAATPSWCRCARSVTTNCSVNRLTMLPARHSTRLPLLGLGYLGGPALSALAQQGEPDRFRFPRPMTDRPGLDFSFSGLKTFALTTLAQETARAMPEQIGQLHADIARAFEDAVVDTLAIRRRRAVEQTASKALVMAWG